MNEQTQITLLNAELEDTKRLLIGRRTLHAKAIEELDKANNKADNYRHELQRTERNLETMTNRNIELGIQKADAENCNVTLRAHNQAQSERLTKTAAELDALRLDLSNAICEYESARSYNADLETTNANLIGDIGKLKEESAIMAKNICHVDTQNNTLRTNLAATKRANDSANAKLKTLEEEIDYLRDRLEDAESDELMQSLRGSIRMLRKRAEQHGELVAEKDKTIDGLRKYNANQMANIEGLLAEKAQLIKMNNLQAARISNATHALRCKECEIIS